MNSIRFAGSKNSSLPDTCPHQLCAVRTVEQFKEDCAESDQNHPGAYKGSDSSPGPSRLTARGIFLSRDILDDKQLPEFISVSVTRATTYCLAAKSTLIFDSIMHHLSMWEETF